MYNPVVTYRLQFHKDFRFDDLEAIIDYLENIGIGTIYASPIFASVPGSNHGYDGINPNMINPEIGSEEQLRAIISRFYEKNIGWLQDMVPNHMAYDYRNQWLMDYLEKGEESEYALFFDGPLEGDIYKGKIMVPFLGSSLNEVVEKGELKLINKDGKFYLQYFDALYPVTSSSVLNEQNSKEDLLKITESQHYRLCSWKETDHNINYRRFFTVNGLICMNIQREEVFNAYHDLIMRLTKEKLFSGLRIDHIDGLYDPSGYLDRLRNSAGDEVYIVAEKILEPGEDIPEFWPIQGTTGYDFLAWVNNLLTNKKSEAAFTNFYDSIQETNGSIEQQIIIKKSYILFHHMAGELENLYHYFITSGLVDKRRFARVRKESVKEAIAEFLIHCPVYRYYGNQLPINGSELESIQRILKEIRNSNHEIAGAVNILEDVLIAQPLKNDNDLNQRILHFYKRCMQFTGPLMAKGVEDTFMYTHFRFIGHNEVGDAPASFGCTIDEFHNAMQSRQKKWPLALNATSTHDTKRGEDVRARLNILTDLSEEWFEFVKTIQSENVSLKNNGLPDANDEYLIYQTIAGAYPMPGEPANDFPDRLTEYMQKALREGKLNSDWAKPNEGYEKATADFCRALLQPDSNFLKEFLPFHQRITEYGVLNSLIQVLLKFTCPGVPDIYQGCELWDFSLVDPDNRRAVDYQKRIEFTKEIDNRSGSELYEYLIKERFKGSIKLWLTKELNQLRKQYPGILSFGEYIPLKVEGTYKNNIIAFARKEGETVIIVAAPLHIVNIAEEQQKQLWIIDWKDTKLSLPKITGEWSIILNHETKKLKSPVELNELFNPFPFCILKGQALETERGAGVLMHVSSLPSKFGIGDMGPEAKNFIDALKRSGQKYWQLLPLNPTEEGQGHSPYSSISSKAGNSLFISPELLQKEGLLNGEDLHNAIVPDKSKVDYKEALNIKEELLDKAWERFKSNNSKTNEEFDAFIEHEKEWLDDFALYAVLKNINKGKPWYEWDEPLKNKDADAIRAVAEKEKDHLLKIKWRQFIFYKQWHQLRYYCNNAGIKLIGDLPFYISYDSADVWSNREIFAIDEKGNRTGMAGVPPDAFSSDGQLWGMPVFKWDVLKGQQYKWWIGRLRKNMELFDIVRLDHFRAFASYWEVPAGEQTAKNGSWKKGPGSDFFSAVQAEFGKLPFIAEDLGEIDDEVYQLRDEFNLPGMKVLQFAFSEDMSISPYIPHNYTSNFIVYTGTHDNNTMLGWVHQEGKDNLARLQNYLGRAIADHEIPDVMARLAYSTVAKLAILPIQDVLGFDENARMNIPSLANDNWSWKLLPNQFNTSAEEKLKYWTGLYNRG